MSSQGPVLHILLSLLMLPVFGQRLWAPSDLPTPTNYVADYANIVEPQHEQALNTLLRRLEEKTGAQLIVLTVTTTGGVPIEQFSIELAEKWKLGRKGRDNGLLFTIAVADRKYRFEVGYGLEGALPDVFCSRLGREEPAGTPKASTRRVYGWPSGSLSTPASVSALCQSPWSMSHRRYGDVELYHAAASYGCWW